jgi:hypothetical protein
MNILIHINIIYIYNHLFNLLLPFLFFLLLGYLSFVYTMNHYFPTIETAKSWIGPLSSLYRKPNLLLSTLLIFPIICINHSFLSSYFLPDRTSPRYLYVYIHMYIYIHVCVCIFKYGYVYTYS